MDIYGQLTVLHKQYQFDAVHAFFINETVSGLKGRVEYSTDLYKASTINRMIGHFKNLLSSIAKNPKGYSYSVQ